MDEAMVDTVDQARHDLVFLVDELIVQDAPLCIAEALHHCLFGSLGTDPVEVLRCDILVVGISDFICRIDRTGGFKVDFRSGILDLLDHILPGNDTVRAVFHIQVHLDVLML